MSNMGMLLNLKENNARIRVLGGKEVNLIEDKQGHLRIPVLRRKVKEELLLEDWKGKSKKEIEGEIMKLHWPWKWRQDREVDRRSTVE